MKNAEKYQSLGGLLKVIEKADEIFFHVIKDWEENRNCNMWDLCLAVEKLERALIANGCKCKRQKMGVYPDNYENEGPDEQGEM